MRQSRVLVQQASNRPRRVENFQRRAWSPRRVRRAPPFDISEAPVAREYIPGEFEEVRSPVWVALKRAVGLTSDITLLALLSPFFAGWFIYRGALRLRRSLP